MDAPSLGPATCETGGGGGASEAGAGPPRRRDEWPASDDKTASSAPQSDDDDETTTANCSETMMSSEATACEQNEPLADRRQFTPAGHSTIERQRLQTGRNRLGTPRHEIAVGQQAPASNQWPAGGRTGAEHCDRVDRDEFELIGNGWQQRRRPQRPLDGSGGLTLVSGQNQGPPSYGTATRSCATLDVGQLQQLHARRLAAGRQQSAGQNCLQINHIEHNISSAAALTSLNCVSLADLAAILSRGGADRTAPGSRGPPIDDSYGFLAGRTDKNQRAGQQRQSVVPPPPPPIAQVGLVDLGAPSATLQRQLDLMAISNGGGSGGNPVASLLSGSLAKKHDEGIYATLNITPKLVGPQQATQLAAAATTTTAALTADSNSSNTATAAHNNPQRRGPPAAHPHQLPHALQINHVISAQASMQQQRVPPQNQLQAGQQQVWIAHCDRLAQPQLNQFSEEPQPRHLAAGGARLERVTADLLVASGESVQQKRRDANDFGTGHTGALPNGDNNDNRHQLQGSGAKSDGSRQHRQRRYRSTSGADLLRDQTCPIDAKPLRDSSTPRAPSIGATNLLEGGDKGDAKMDAPRSGPAAEMASARATISAHCWLIDSADDQDQDEEPGGQRRDSRRSGAEQRKRSAQQRARQSQTLKSFNRTASSARRRLSGAQFATLAAGSRASAPAGRRVHQVDSAQSTASLPSTRPSGSSEGRRRFKRRTAKSCASSTSAYSNASAVVRLSAMLNFVSNLVSGRSRSAGAGRPKSQRSSSTSSIHLDQGGRQGQTAATMQAQHRYQSAAASSLAYSSSTSAYVTGNSSLHSHDCGSSFAHVPLSSVVQPAQAVHRATLQAGAGGSGGRLEADLLDSARLKLVTPTITNYQPNSLGPISHHAYEYCDDGPEQKPMLDVDLAAYEDHATNRARLAGREQIELATLSRSQRSQSSMSSGADEMAPDSVASTCSPAQLVGLNQTGLIGSRLGGPERLSQVVMSDNELIGGGGGGGNSTASDSNGAQTPARCNQAGRRWWWHSLRLMCSSTRLNSTDEDDDESLTRSRPAGPPNVCSLGGAAALGANGSNPGAGRRQPSRYRSLKSTRGRHGSSTLDNVISLAKIDRVFRCRLLASLMVSAILFALICLLIVIISRRGSGPAGAGLQSSLRLQSAWSRLWPNFGLGHTSNSPFESAASRQDAQMVTNFDEFDVSWLWSGPEAADASAGHSEQWHRFGRQRNLADQQDFPRKHSSALDANLRSLLSVIDRSERLDQFQASLTHLSNLQLASDSHIDLVELAAEVLRAPAAAAASDEDEPSRREPNSTRASRGFKTKPEVGGHNPKLAQLDLFALTLLSNLHWPLVKWRHQSQQSSISSSFLSLAIPGFGGSAPPSPASPSAWGLDGAQTVRSLLSSLILVESLSSQMVGQYANLRQIQKLHLNLRATSYHLAACSQNPSAATEAHDLESVNFARHRRRFCMLLVRRYTRMMLAMGQLNHQDLTELHRVAPIELAKSVHQPKEKSTATARRNILSWMLDRLALLDVRTLAEVTLTSGFAHAELGSLPLLDDLGDELDEGPSQWEIDDQSELDFERPGNRGESLDILRSLLITDQNNFEPKSGILMSSMLPAGDQSSPRHDKPQEHNLFELVETFVGNTPIKRLIATKAADRDEGEKGDEHRANSWQARYLNDLASVPHRSQQWFELLVYDMLSPWPSYKLPKFMRPRNYDLFLHPNLTTRLVLGVNKIEFELERPTNFLVLNCAHLNLIDLSVVQLRAAAIANASTNTMQQVAIRRALRLEPQEMLYIEFEEHLEPTTRLDGDHQSGPKATIDFGELNDGSSAPGQAVIKNQFLLSVSFNKTNLMSGAHGQGLEFIRYADYFVPATGSQPKESSDSIGGGQPTPDEEDESSLKALMFSTFNAEPHGLATWTRPLERRRIMASDAYQTRQIVPCLDEPQFRAKWQLNVVHDSNSQALSTGQRRERLPYNALGSLQMTIFEQLPVALSPNQLSILVCDLNNFRSLSSRAQIPSQLIKGNSSTTRRQIQVQVWAQLEHLNQAELLSQLIPPLLAFYQTHLNFVYPLDKLDLVALPEVADQQQQQQTIAGGGNPAISRETRHGLGLLVLGAAQARPLVDVNLISQDLLERISMWVARQLAHQFLGNIVAPHSNQRDLWLFEALAEHLDSLAVSEAQPEWHLDKQFPVSSVQEVLADEQTRELAGSAPIRLPAAPLNDATAANYSEQILPAGRLRSARRAAAIVHMLLETLLPTPASRAQLMQNCIQTFQYGSMSTRQFWRLLTGQLLDTTKLTSGGHLLPLLDESARQSPFVTIYAATPANSEQLEQAPVQSALHNADSSTTDERVVFVSRHHRPSSPLGALEDDSHHVQATLGTDSVLADDESRPRAPSRVRSTAGHHRARDQLELMANVWIERSGFPLITASCNRDTLHLQQDSFRFAPNQQGDEETLPPVGPSVAGPDSLHRRRRRDTKFEQDPLETIWPIPLMFVSRLNPKSPRFVWFDRREMELALQADGDRSAKASEFVATSNSSGHPHHLATLLTSPSASNSKLPQQYSWFKLNHNGSSLVRVNYDERNWEALISLLTRAHYSNHPLNPLDRANLLDDALTLMRFGQLSVNLAMNLTLYLELGERDYQPWQTIIKHLDQFQTLLNQNPLWHQYVLKLIQPISIVVGWKDDGPHLMRKLRRELYQLAIQYGDEKVLAKARHEFRQWVQRTSQFIVPNLQELVYVAGVRYGDQQEWFHCWQKYQQLMASSIPQLDVVSKIATGNSLGSIELNSMPANSQNLVPLVATRVAGGRSHFIGPSEPKPMGFDSNDVSFVRSEQRQLLTALASTQNTWLLEQFLNYSLDPTKIHPYHLNHVVRTLGKNPVARLYLWRFVRLNWLELLQRFVASDHPKWHMQTADQSADDEHYQGAPDDFDDNQSASILETMISESTKHFATKPDYDEVNAFFEAKIKAGQPAYWSDSMKRTVRASLATIRANIHWRNTIEPKLTRWLSNFNSLS